MGEDDAFGAWGGALEGFEVGEERGDFGGGGGGAEAAEGDAWGVGGWEVFGRGSAGVEAVVVVVFAVGVWGEGEGSELVVVPDDFENVALVDGFAAVEAARRFVLVGLVGHVVKEAFLAGTVPAPGGDGGVDHGLFATDGALFIDFGLDLLEDVSAELACDILVCGVGGKTINEFLKIHVVSQAIGNVRRRSGFFFFCSDSLIASKDRMAAGLAQTENLGENSGIRFQERSGFHVGIERTFCSVVDVIINLTFMFGELNLFYLDSSRWKWNECFSIRCFHVFCSAKYKRFENGLHYIESPNKVLRLERHGNEGFPE